MSGDFLAYWPKNQCSVRCKCGPKLTNNIKALGQHGEIIFVCGKCGKIRSASLAASRYRMIYKEDPYTGMKYVD